jgi:hypothetical protein
MKQKFCLIIALMIVVSLIFPASIASRLAQAALPVPVTFTNDVDAPIITINSPTATDYLHTDSLTLDFSAVDVGDAGLLDVWANLDGMPVVNGQVIDLLTLSVGDHTLTVYAIDNANNQSSTAVTFTVYTTVQNLEDIITQLYEEGKIDEEGVYNSLLVKLNYFLQAFEEGNVCDAASKLNDFINEVSAQSGKHITPDAAALLSADAQWLVEPYYLCFLENPNKVFLPIVTR